ncbi:GNAT family N-acetyltransferase [Clostridium sp. MCC353]|nr:GNAT family N-acetyltransferase [Clostridium sp. MCC353]
MTEEEYPLLEGFLYDAVFQPEGSAPLPREVILRPELAVYIQGFGKADDICLAAESHGKALGAVWTRIMAGEARGYGTVDESIPELAISVKKEFRNQGIGKRLMKEITAVLKERGYKGVSLSVDKANYALRMYEDLGFRVVKDEGEGCLMILDL